MKTQIKCAFLVALMIGAIASSLAKANETLPTDEIVQFPETAFYWDKVTKPWKKYIMEGVARVYRDNPRCKNIDPSSTYVSMNKGTKSNPVFFVTCDTPNGSFNYFFSKSDVDKKRLMIDRTHIDQANAIDLCEKYVRNHVKNIQTLHIATNQETVIDERWDGTSNISSTFLALNAEGYTTSYAVQCLFDQSELKNGVIKTSKP